MAKPGYGNRLKPRSGGSRPGIGNSLSPTPKPKYTKAQMAAGVARWHTKRDAAKAASPAAPGAPAASPYDPYANGAYIGAQSLANTQYANTTTNLFNQENQRALDIGGTLTRDAGQNITGANIDYSTIDVTNPFSKAALLKRSYDQQREGTTNSMAAQGQLYSGALLNARGNQQFGYEANQDSLSKQLQEIVMQGGVARQQAGIDRDTSAYQALLNALQNT